MQKLIVLIISSILLLQACNPVTDRFQEIFSDKHITDNTSLDKKQVNLTQLDEIFLPIGKEKSTNNQGYLTLEQVYAIDGDTIKAVAKKDELKSFGIDTNNMPGTGNTVSVTVRYLLTDTPESVHPTKKAQPYSKEASNRNSELLYSNTVRIQFDVGNKVDKYGRLLAYVFVGDKMVQEILIREGYARVAYIEAPNTTYLKTLQVAEESAKAKKLKVWSIPGYVTEKGFNDK